MEQGSLLQEALEHMERMRQGGNVEDDNARAALQVSVYDLEPPLNRIERLQRLAKLSVTLNSKVQDYNYPWHSGYAPVFGIHVEERIPHLRALCRYGDDVNDEWMMIRIVMEVSREYPTVAWDCWDLEVGPILLIEASEGLPTWLGEGCVDDSRHLCWIVKGEIVVIGPTTVGYTLREALNCLKHDQNLTVHPKVQSEIQHALKKYIYAETQRTALVVPRSIARLLQQQPQVANAAAVAYVKHPQPVSSEYEDWVWTTCTLARTNYAMLRSVEPQSSQKLSVEMKRLQRACAKEATPHVQHALQVGMHLTAGIDVMLKEKDEENISSSPSPLERRVLQDWCRIDVECGGDGEWLRQAWRMGPNHSPVDFTYITRCPVHEAELQYPYPLVHSGVTMAQRIRAGMRAKPKDDTENYAMPRPEDVDDEAWMHRGEEALEEAMAQRNKVSVEAQQTEQLDNVLGGFEKFMTGQSDVEGISHEEPAVTEDVPRDTTSEPSETPVTRGLDEPVRINPRVFLNLLHEVLKTTPKELSRQLTNAPKDPFFSEEDYALMEPDDSSADSRDSEEIETIMEAMDNELHEKAASRDHDKVTGEGGIADDTVSQNAHVLSNLMQSLGASDGAPGPVSNILKEMGVEPPRLRSDDMEDSNNE